MTYRFREIPYICIPPQAEPLPGFEIVNVCCVLDRPSIECQSLFFPPACLMLRTSHS
jgi:hypothetical protein